MTAQHVIWSDLGGPGLEHLKLRRDEEGYLADGICIGCSEETTPYRLHYEIRTDPDWRMTSVSVKLMDGPDGTDELFMAVDEGGKWRNGAGEAIPDLEGCHEIDLFATPFTNTLPIRRLRLAAGESAEISVAYIDTPSLEVRPVRQRYECIRPFDAGKGLYRYEALFRSGTSVEIEVDSEALVVEYANNFRRVWPEEG